MHKVNMHEAKSKLSALVEEALAGEDVIIAKAGRPLVRLVPFQEAKKPRKPGRLKVPLVLSDAENSAPLWEILARDAQR